MNQPLKPHVASFVDWSPALTVATMQRDVTFLERNLKTLKVSQTKANLPLRYPVPCAQSGRMFWNPTKTTTRGELSIIDGICRNRSGRHRERQVRVNQHPSSHKFAWHYADDVTQQRCDAIRTRAERSHDNSEQWLLGPIRKKALDLNDEHVMTSFDLSATQVRQDAAESVAIYSRVKRQKLGKKSRRVGGVIVAKQVERSKDNPQILQRKTVLDVFLPLTGSDSPPSLKYTNASDVTVRPGSFTTEEVLRLRNECEEREREEGEVVCAVQQAPPPSPPCKY